MFNDVDETLRQLLIADVPIERGEVDITFDRPTREWSSRLSKPTLNLFLFDVRERVDFRDDAWVVSRNANGTAVRERPPRRVDLAYVATAWTSDPDDEHRILAGVLACTYRQAKIDPKFLQGALVNATTPLLVRAMPPDYLCKPSDFWGVMDNELHASLTWVATVPIDVFAPITGPMVRTKEIFLGPKDGAERESLIQIAGVAHRKGDLLAGIPGLQMSIVGTGLGAQTDAEGKFSFPRIEPGSYVLRTEVPGGKVFERSITVPSDTYDLEIAVD